MNSRKDPLIVLEIIGEAVETALSFVEGYSRDQFLADQKTQAAVAMQLIRIGEEATQLLKTFPQFVANNPKLSLNSVVGMRNRIAHGYTTLKMDVVWDTVTVHLPEFLHHITSTLRDAKTGNGSPTPTPNSGH